MSEIITYKYPKGYNENEKIKVFVNGIRQTVFSTPSTDIAAFSVSGSCEIDIEYDCYIEKADIRPLSYGICAELKENRAHIELSGPVSILVDIPGQRQLHIHANEIDTPPERNEKGLRYYEAGKVYDEGEISLRSGEKIYIEGGAVVRGVIMTEDADNVEISGNGIFDGSLSKKGQRMFIFRRCNNLTIRNIIMVRPQLWMLMLHECSNVSVSNIKQVGEVISSDGVDIVGSDNVTVEGCFLRNNDDCIAIKAFPSGEGEAHNVRNIMVKNCVFLNDVSGNATEIGHELRCKNVKDITFENCDILSVHGYGAAFSIHNADNAVVENITYKNIRVEHYYDKLVDLRVIKSMWGKAHQRGHVRNVIFKDIYVKALECNSGYSISLIGGYDSEHMVKDVLFDNFRINDEIVENGDELDLFTKNAANITFKMA